jgi:hypothetical protein
MVFPSYERPISHPYKRTDKITVLYISFFKFLETGREDKKSELNGSKHS